MSITTCDHNLCLFGMVLQESGFDLLNNGNPFAPPTDPGPAPVNTIGKAAQITEIVRLYKYDKEKFTTYCEFRIILFSMITNKCLEKIHDHSQKLHH